MSLQEIQDLKETNSNSVSETLILDENKLVETINNTEKNLDFTPTKILEINKKISVTQSIKSKMSNYCLCLNVKNQKTGILDGPVSILPLSIGINSIGRSNESNICIVNKSVSKKHAIIELIERENGDFDDCLIWDVGSLNKTKISQDILKKDEKKSIKLNDSFQFGLVRFDLVKMTENQIKEQENNRIRSLLVDDNLYSNKEKNLNEIQNTLDDTIEINEKENKLKNDTVYVSDTDPEDDEEEELHLEMSASINQSIYSTKSFVIPDTMVNEDIQEENEEEQLKEDLVSNGNSEKTNGNHEENGTEIKNESKEESIKETVIIQDTLVISDSLPSNELNTIDVLENTSKEVKSSLENSLENGSDKIVKEQESMVNGEATKELIILETKTVETQESLVEINAPLVEKPDENMIIDESVIDEIVEENVKNNSCNTNETEKDEILNKENLVVAVETIIPNEEKLDETKSMVNHQQELSLVEKEVSPIDVSLVISENKITNDDNIKEININITENEGKKQTDYEENSNLNENHEIVIESTLWDNSKARLDEEEESSKITINDESLNENVDAKKLNRRGRKPKAEISIAKTSVDSEIAEENSITEKKELTEEKQNPALIADDKTPETNKKEEIIVEPENLSRLSVEPLQATLNEEVLKDGIEVKKPNRRGRKPKTETTVDDVSAISTENVEETPIERSTETVEVKEKLNNKRRSTRVSIAPVPSTSNLNTTKAEAKQSKSNKNNNQSNASASAIVDSNETEMNATAEKPEANKEKTNNNDEASSESKLGRRSSLRIRTNIASSANLAREKLLNKQAKASTSAAAETPTKRKKESLTTIESSKKLKTPKMPTEIEEEQIEEDEENEETQSKATKSSRKSKANSNRSKITEEKGEEEEEEEEKPSVVEPVKSKRAYNRRKTIAVDSQDLEKAKKETNITKKLPLRAKNSGNNIDTYKYDESHDESDTENTITKNKRKSSAASNLVEKKEISAKKRKSKSNQMASAIIDSESEKEEDKNASEIQKKRGRKRKSTDSKPQTENTEEQKQLTTPKLFFQSKNRVNGETPNRPSVEPSSSKKNSNTLNQPDYSSVMNSKLTDVSLNTSTADGQSPSKKFKLLKTKSSSSENLKGEDTSSDEESKKIKQKLIKSPKQIKSPLNTSVNKKNVSFTEEITTIPKETNDSKTENETSNEVESTAPKSKKQVKLNATVVSEKPASKESSRNRLSLQVNPSSPPTSTRQNSRNLKGNNIPKIMTTGILLTDKQKKLINDLGGQLVTDVKDCTHLITNKIRRTYKFLACVNKSAFILNERWLDECSKNKMFLNTNTFALTDAQFEKKHKFSLQTSLSRSKSSQLFQNWKFLIKCTDSDPEMTVNHLKTIIECGKGEILEEIPSEQDELSQCFIVYDNEESLKEEKNPAHVQVNKILLDELLDSVLKQSFDNSK